MSDNPDAGTAGRFSRRTTLRNGTPALIRLARPEDRDRIVAAFDALEPESVYTRFFAARQQLTASELDRLGTSDGVNFVWLLALVGDGADATVVGSASYVAFTSTADGARSAEVAFTIEEDYQGQGLAGQLLATLAGIARHNGIKRFEAEVLPVNAPMLRVFERSGLPLTSTRGDGVTHLAMDLGASAGDR